MEADVTLKIPTEYLPDGWRKMGSKKFNLKEETIGKIINGKRDNAEVFDYFIDLAIKGKAKQDEEQAARLSALKLLNQ